MSAAVEIPIRSRLDAKGFTDLDANLKKAGTATANLGRGLSTAIGSSMGPFGELIEKASTFNEIAGQAGPKFALGMGAVGLAVAATSFTVNKAAEAYKEMDEAQQDATKSAQQLAAVQSKITDTIKENGIARGMEAEATKQLIEQYTRLAALGDKAGMAKVNEQLDRVRSGETATQGEKRLGGAMLTTAAKSALEEASNALEASKLSTSDLPSLREELQGVNQKITDLSQQPVTRQTAFYSNLATNEQARLERLIKALEERSKSEEEAVAFFQAEGVQNQQKQQAAVDDALSSFFDGQFRTQSGKPESAIGSMISDSRTRIGGSQNAPILSTWKTMQDLQRQTAANTAAIARNTVKPLPSAPVVSPAGIR